VLALLVALVDVDQNLLGKIVHRDIVLPAPIFEGVLVVKTYGPGLSDGLSPGAGIV